MVARERVGPTRHQLGDRVRGLEVREPRAQLARAVGAGPQLTHLAREDVPVLGINYRDTPQDALGFLRRHGNPFARLGRDETGRVGIEWGVYGVPETYIVDAEGRISYRHVGPLMPFDLDEKILPLIRELQK